MTESPKNCQCSSYEGMEDLRDKYSPYLSQKTKQSTYSQKVLQEHTLEVIVNLTKTSKSTEGY